jgi:DNA-binding NtrC family response regulator
VTSQNSTILIIDDDAEIRYSLDRVLTPDGHTILTADSGEEGVEVAEKQKPNLIFLDNRMGGISGIETLQHLRTAAPSSLVILMTAYGTTQTAIQAMKHGAFDYVLKPFDLAKLKEMVAKALKASIDTGDSEKVTKRLLNKEDFEEGIVGSGEKMQQVLKKIGQVAASEATVMITGESGTGKELVARCIHRHSHRSDGAFHAVNCGAIPENLIESELFGHEKGAFTGATEAKAGQFEICHKGTLFLDEIGDMGLPTQTKILRAIQEGEIQRVGSTKVKKVDVRLIAATHKDLELMVKDKTFREDLYYRLNVVRIETPPLRDRIEDLPELVNFMLQRLHKRHATGSTEISDDALTLLADYTWPGNVRELENALHSASVVSKGKRILAKDLPQSVTSSVSVPASRTNVKTVPVTPQTTSNSEPPSTNQPTPREEPVFGVNDQSKNNHPEVKKQQNCPPPSSITLDESFDIAYSHLRAQSDKNLIEFMEKEVIGRVLKECGGNQVKASALLGITRATLRKRIDSYGIRY